MAKKEKNKNGNGKNGKEKKKASLLSERTKRWIKATLMFLATIVVALSFWERSGVAGKFFMTTSQFLIGRAVFTVPLFFFLGGLIFLRSKSRGRTLALFLAIFISIIGISGILASRNLGQMDGGWIGFLMGKLLVGFFGILVANIVFGSVILIGAFIFIQFVWQEYLENEFDEYMDKKPSFSAQINKSEDATFKIKGVEQEKNETAKNLTSRISLFKKPLGRSQTGEAEDAKEKKSVAAKGDYVLPPLDLLNKNETAPTSGNIKENSMIIKSTLENFGIPVEMAEVNVGPTVTQYAFKPAEGVKLSKITTLSNNLALALAAHPIRIEAPIPGKSLVGIEVPNKVRSIVTLRNLITHPNYQNENSPLTVALGRNVSGVPVFTDITEGPHLLVAGATGTGKTIFLNTLILSLLYKCAPDNLRMIMVDPKRVEFQHYNDIPHLLCPVIYDATKTINALQWLTREMERRFEVFSEVPARNLATYNANKSIIASGLCLPYIVFVVDELADLMAAKGREIEAGVVRLAQMARATGIHLVLATHMPSVEFI